MSEQKDMAQEVSLLHLLDILDNGIFDVKRTLDALSEFTAGADGAAMRTCSMALSSSTGRTHEIRNRLLAAREGQGDE